MHEFGFERDVLAVNNSFETAEGALRAALQLECDLCGIPGSAINEAIEAITDDEILALHNKDDISIQLLAQKLLLQQGHSMAYKHNRSKA